MARLPAKKMKNKDDTHSTRKNNVLMTNYGTSDKIIIREHSIQIKNVSLWHHNGMYYETALKCTKMQLVGCPLSGVVYFGTI